MQTIQMVDFKCYEFRVQHLKILEIAFSTVPIYF